MFKTVLLLAVFGVCLGQFGRFPSSNRSFKFLQPQTLLKPQQFRPPQPFKPIQRTSRPVPVVQLLRSDSKPLSVDGSYSFDFASEDGISRSEQGRRKSDDTYEIVGSYSYTAPDGTPVQVSFIADEFGFRADSPNLPVAPPAPAHALEQIRAAEQAFARKGQTFRSSQPTFNRFSG